MWKKGLGLRSGLRLGFTITFKVRFKVLSTRLAAGVRACVRACVRARARVCSFRKKLLTEQESILFCLTRYINVDDF